MAKKKTRVNPRILKDLVDHMNGPAGGGDMYKSVYDTDNDGKVDQAEEADTLDGQHASAFAGASHTHPGGDVTSQVGDADTVDGSHAAAFATAGHDHAATYAPIAKGVTNGDSHDHLGGDGAAIAEGALTLSDVTTGDLSTSKHGFAPKAPNDTSKFLRGDGAWAAPAGGLGYTLKAGPCNAFSPSNGATYYFGSYVVAPITTSEYYMVINVPKAGTIKAAVVEWYTAGTLGSDEIVSFYVRKQSGSVESLIGQETMEAVWSRVMNTALNIPVNAGNTVVIKMVCPTWVTKPTNVYLAGTIYIE